jgi:hypothetical protein
VNATVESSLTVSPWPCGHVAGSAEAVIGRLTSKVSPQARHRNSYRGMNKGYDPGAGVVLAA